MSKSDQVSIYTHVYVRVYVCVRVEREQRREESIITV